MKIIPENTLNNTTEQTAPIKKIKHRPYCIYQSALNLENAKKKFLKIVKSELEKTV